MNFAPLVELTGFLWLYFVEMAEEVVDEDVFGGVLMFCDVF